MDLAPEDCVTEQRKEKLTNLGNSSLKDNYMAMLTLWRKEVCIQPDKPTHSNAR